MFTSPAPAPPPALSPLTTPAPHPRPSGLRGGLSFLRNYTHSLHSHPAAAQPTAPDRPLSPDSHDKPSGRPHPPTAAPLSPAFTAGASSRTTTTTTTTSSSSRPDTLARTHTAPHINSQSPPDSPLLPPPIMTRNRAETAAPQLTVRNQSGPTPASPMASNAAQSPPADGPAHKNLPCIRFIMHQDPRAARPSLQFSTVTRTLPDESSVIKVGRYSERDVLPEVPNNVPSAAAVGFKSKVVSRKHCELWCKDGDWYIKDVKSSSGTFLNHIRLSQPNQESKPFKLKDGDIIQLGIDFRGGEEMIFRCVKIRIECNRGWQQSLNAFNKQTHQRLRNLGKAKKDGDSASTHASECSICLMSIAPCQSLFVAPCSHVWHYKCIRPILNGPTWPNFLCPNCRAVADLEADVEDIGEFEDWNDDVAQDNDDTKPDGDNPQGDRHVTPKVSSNALEALSSEHPEAQAQISFSDLEAAISNISITESLNGIANQPVPAPSTPQRDQVSIASSSVTHPVAINISSANEGVGLSPMFRESYGLSPDRAPDCPMTPRNDAGPFVLDGSGSAGRATGQRIRETDSSHSLSAASGTT